MHQASLTFIIYRVTGFKFNEYLTLKPDMLILLTFPTNRNLRSEALCIFVS